MDLFRSGLKTVLGSPQDGPQSTGAETVEKLINRLTSSTLLEDRRDACRGLKAMSRKYCVEVGAQGMGTLINVLETDRNDSEILGYALDTLCNITATGPLEMDEKDEDANHDMNEIGGQFTEIYIKKPDNVTLVLQLLEEFDFQVRWPAVKLLTNLLLHSQRELQECILVSPMAVSKLMDLLSDSREVIRNDTLLLLLQLSKNHANIQKIIAFENAFDRLIDIIAEEGFSDGGIVVEDCLLLLLNLLRNNTSNQTFFKEGSFIQKLRIFFNLEPDSNDNVDSGWSAQKVTNIHLMLQVLRTLVAPSNSLQVTSSCQKVMNTCGLLEQLCNILMASGVPADILTETINAVAEIIRGNHGNQEYFASVIAPSVPPKPAIVVLLMSMVNEKQPFVLRCAVLYCFQCFLYKNELGQAQIIQTLLPTSADVTTTTAGQLLCGGLFSGDTLSSWFAAIALAHSLIDNPTQKEQLLRVQLATSVGNPPVSLMNQCSIILQQGVKVQTRTGLLILISVWISNCSVAVNHFLSIPTNIPFLTSQVGHGEGDDNESIIQGICAFVLGLCILFNDNSVPSFTKQSLIQLIENRIGLETFLNKLGMISKSDYFTGSLRLPEPKNLHTSGVMFDFEFCRLFRSFEGDIIKAVQPNTQGSLANGPESNLSQDQHQLLVQYKDVIRDQDQKLNILNKQFSEMSVEHSNYKQDIQEMTLTIQQLKDQNALLKAQNSVSSGQSGAAAVDENDSTDKNVQMQLQINELKAENDRLNSQLAQVPQNAPPVFKMYGADDNDELRSQLEDKNALITKLKLEIAELTAKLQEIPTNASSTVSTEQNDEMKEQLDTLQREQEDLLVLLSEQDNKLMSYRKQLRELGVKIEDDDDFEDDDEEDNSESTAELTNNIL